MLSRRSR